MNKPKTASLTFLKGAIHTLCGNDSLRPVMMNVFFNDGKVVATDAHVIMIQDLRICHGLDEDAIQVLDGKQIHKDNVADLMKCDFFEFYDDCIVGSIKGKKSKVKAEFEENPPTYPNYKAVIPSAQDSLEWYAINPTFLEKIHKAAVKLDKDSVGVKMRFTGQSRGAVVSFKGYSESEQMALIMPMAWKELESDKRDEAKAARVEREDLRSEIEDLNDQLKSREPSNLYDEQKREITDALFSGLELPTLEEIKTYYL